MGRPVPYPDNYLNVCVSALALAADGWIGFYVSLHRCMVLSVAADILLLDTTGTDSPRKQEHMPSRSGMTFQANTPDIASMSCALANADAHANHRGVLELISVIRRVEGSRLTCLWDLPLHVHSSYDPERTFLSTA